MFTEHEVVKYSKSGIYQYYYCNKCNTDRLKKYRQTEVGRRNVYNAVYRSMKKHAYKQKARRKLYEQIKLGKVIRPNICSVCLLSKKIEGHHTDYSKPLDVIWCCRSCHAILDRNMQAKATY